MPTRRPSSWVLASLHGPARPRFLRSLPLFPVRRPPLLLQEAAWRSLAPLTSVRRVAALTLLLP